ncbi:MAG: flagellar biosynthesis protein FliQ [Tissierellia bacterium]|nr:flagellar biosynthesis protein FliQ [Tissierellia bacterium]MDD4726414.1 flagellar biosynthesis protein FliQ [Tissierellia bacterium]
MTQVMAIDIIRSAFITVLKVAMPVLLIAMGVGLIVSLLQAVTQIQEQTLSFVPKILSVIIALFLFGNYMLDALIEFTENLYRIIGGIV